MRPWQIAKAYLLTTLPRDLKVVLGLVASHKLQTTATFLGLLVLTLLVGLLVMWVATGDLPSVAVNTDYWGLAVHRLTAATARELPTTLLDLMRIYLDYPAVWFTFERIGFEEQTRTLAMDTTTIFPVVNVRYLLDNAPIALLLAAYLILSRHRAKEMRTVKVQGVSQVVSISLPGGSSALASALAPMACCGGTAVQAVASVMGFAATAPAAILFSRVAVIGVAALLIVGIARIARRINSACC